MDTRDLITAIVQGQSTQAQAAFEEIVANKVSAAIDARTQEVAASFGMNEAEKEAE